jgi:hypothetical protein
MPIHLSFPSTSKYLISLLLLFIGPNQLIIIFQQVDLIIPIQLEFIKFPQFFIPSLHFVSGLHFLFVSVQPQVIVYFTPHQFTSDPKYFFILFHPVFKSNPRVFSNLLELIIVAPFHQPFIPRHHRL